MLRGRRHQRHRSPEEIHSLPAADRWGWTAPGRCCPRWGQFSRIGSAEGARVLHGVAPRDAPWDAFGVGFVRRSDVRQGRRRQDAHRVHPQVSVVTRDSLSGHLESGARRVILSSTPDEELDNLVVIGVNEDAVFRSLINAADCIVSTIRRLFHDQCGRLALDLHPAPGGVTKLIAPEDSRPLSKTRLRCRLSAMLTSVHPYTSDQPLRDRVGTQFRRSRSAAVNIIPSMNVSQAPRWIEHLLPQLRGKIEARLRHLLRSMFPCAKARCSI